MKKKSGSKSPTSKLSHHRGERNAGSFSSGAADIPELFTQALSQHQAGRFGEAQVLYEKILARNAQDINVLNNLGTLHLQCGHLEEGIRLIERSLRINPNQPKAYNNRGNALQAVNNLNEALASYDRAIAFDPNYAEAYYNRGNVLQGLKRHNEALASYDRAIALSPNYAPVFYNRGIALKELKRMEEALANFDRAIALRADFVQAHCNRGNTLSELNRRDEALASYDRAIAIKPDYAEAYCNRGNVLKELKRLDEAMADFDRALALKRDYADAYSNRGNALNDLKRLDEALDNCNRAIALMPDFAEAYCNRGNTLLALKRYDEAFASYDKAIAIKPDLPYAVGSWLHTKMLCCNWQDLDLAFGRITEAVKLGEKASSPFSLLPIPSDPAQQQHCARTYIRDKYPASATPLWRGERHRHDRIRIGYFSADFRDHPVAHLIVQLLERHDRAKFEIIGFSFGPPASDAWRQRLQQSVDRFFDLGYQTDQQIAGLAREQEIDIAIDLNGHTQDARTGVFALRPAPVQVNYLGYPGTLGADYIDYIIADPMLVPPEHQAYYDEKIVYLPDSYQVNDSTKLISDRPFSRAERGLPENAFVFCSFNNSYKITPDLFAVWMRLLHAVEGSVLWLSQGTPAAAANLRHEADKRGISPERLVFAPRVESLADHLARHRQADLFLDTFYYNAHTTASDALWAGLPVLTCLGETFAGRVAASLLNAVGLPEMITRTPAEYESLALELATRPERLAAIRQKLAENRTTQPLFDTARFTRNIEQAYLIMHQRSQAGLSPQHMVVEAYPSGSVDK